MFFLLKYDGRQSGGGTSSVKEKWDRTLSVEPQQNYRTHQEQSWKKLLVNYLCISLCLINRAQVEKFILSLIIDEEKKDYGRKLL